MNAPRTIIAMMFALLSALLLSNRDRSVHIEGAEKNGNGARCTAVKNVVLVIHGGAGVIERAKMSKDDERKYLERLNLSVKAGAAVLDRNGSSLDSVVAAIRVLEDSPLFNAGKGAVFTNDGTHRLDASIMEGNEKRAGAVAGVGTIKNPIRAARLVMEKSEHVLLTGRGAEMFAASHGLEIVDPAYFWTLPRWQRLQEVLKQEKTKTSRRAEPERYLGTVGAVAVDRAGNIAAGTSTGGMTNVKHGRVGDSPIIGAGTYADNEACGVSGTGHGEIFIRFSVAHEITSLVKHRKLAVHDAARTVLDSLPYEEGGVGGVIVLDRQGNCALAFNTDGMYRGYLTRDGKVHAAIY